MSTYRAYRIDERRRIQSAEWLEAPDDASAKAQAGELCDQDSAKVELWQSTRLVEQIDCDDEADA
jgi:hypothetical protein